MEQNTVILDISSDEDPALDAPGADNDYSWLSKFLCDEADDSDEVVVVGEIKSKFSKPTAHSEDDDDCVVLDGDPDKLLASYDGDDQAGEGDGDDLVIVGQKGQIACRDYPHPRHLCAKFPFSSNAHKTHCNLCHCYVCDIPAPCAHWGSGLSNVDHCHASEKDEFWKSQRKSFRLQKDDLLTLKVPDPSLPTALPPLNQTPACDIIQLSSIPQNQVSRPAVIRACPSSTRLAIPNTISHVRSRRSGPGFSRNRLPTRTVSPQMLGVRNNVIRSSDMFKRTGIAGGASEVNHFVYGSANNTRGAHSSQCTRNPIPQSTSNDSLHVQWVPSMNHDSFTYQSTPQTSMGNVFVSTVPSQVHSQPLPQPVYSQPMTQQPVYSQPIAGPHLHSQPIPQPPVYSRHFPQSNDGQNANQLGQYTTGPDFSEFDEWVNNNNQSNQQPQVKNCQILRTGSTNEPLPAEEFNSVCNESAKFHYDYTGSDNWYTESPYVQVSEEYVPTNLDVLTPDPAAFDEDMLLFDFETSFNGLAHA